MIQKIMEFTDTVIYPAFEAEWTGRIMPQPIISLLEIGDVALAPYVLAVLRKDPGVSYATAKKELEQMNLFNNPSMCDWFLENSNRFPATASYICQLDLVRRCCLEALMGQKSPSG